MEIDGLNKDTDSRRGQRSKWTAEREDREKNKGSGKTEKNRKLN